MERWGFERGSLVAALGGGRGRIGMRLGLEMGRSDWALGGRGWPLGYALLGHFGGGLADGLPFPSLFSS